MIDVRRQSSSHIEAKITVPIPEEKKTSLEVNYYIFTPEHLTISPELFTTSHFLTKLQSYGRYSSPELSLKELLDVNNSLSMLTILDRYSLLLTNNNKNLNTSRYISELQELVNTFRHLCTENIRTLVKMLNLKMEGDVITLVEDYYVDILEFRKRFYTLKKVMEEQRLGFEQCYTAMLWADEAISLLMDENAVDIIRLLIKKEAYSKTCKLMQILASDELHYRQEQNYISGNIHSDVFALRKADLKKWSQSIMYLHPKYSALPRRIGQVSAGVAAAIAMTFATIASIYAENFYMKNSMQWALIVIIAYVFKDRIKEWLRILLSRFIPRLMAEEMYTFKSPRRGISLAKCRNFVRFYTPDNIKEEIILKRKKDNNPFYDLLPEEQILCFTRDIQICPYPKRKDEEDIQPWVKKLAIVDKINISDFLTEMEDVSAVHYYSSLDQIYSTEIIKNYNIHLIIDSHDFSTDQSELSHYLVLINKDGIVRIEQV